MKGLRAGLAAVPLVAGAASAAVPLNNAQLDTVTGAQLTASSLIRCRGGPRTASWEVLNR
jgi:hypothetical protein